MAKSDYQKALKMGEKASRAAAARGESPCLAALDDFLRTADVLDEVNLGRQAVFVCAEFYAADGRAL